MTSVTFHDFIPTPQICTSFFQSVIGFSPAKGALRCDLCLSARFSTPCEDGSSVVSGVLTYVPISLRYSYIFDIHFGRYLEQYQNKAIFLFFQFVSRPFTYQNAQVHTKTRSFTFESLGFTSVGQQPHCFLNSLEKWCAC